MMEQLIKNYAEFHDALVLNVEHKTNIAVKNASFEASSQEVILVLSCYRSNTYGEKDMISIKFSEVEAFQYSKLDDLVTSLFIGMEHDFYVLDFDPIITSDKVGAWLTKRNLDSKLSITFKTLTYAIIG
ncbi:MAG: hypothetical protein RL427_680 [Bacteroidota bacterium]|jgi:hypothetical protein